ncbi:MAG TPA: flippase [Candidatus Binataceae bacterium]|nr:flippase [Candidatus Binataceae bacterium]
MKQSELIVKNLLAGGVAVGIGGLLQTVAIILVARYVSVSMFGTYSFILAFAMFFQFVADSGVSNILMRDLAVSPERMAETLGGALWLSWLLSIGVGLVMGGIIPFFHFSSQVKLLTAIMGINCLSNFPCGCWGAVLRSQEDNELHAAGFLLHKILFLTLIYFSLRAGMGLTGIVFAHLIPNLIQWWFYRWLVLNYYVRPRMDWNPRLWKYLFVTSLPVGGATMVRMLAQQVDVIILAWLTDLRTVGLFSGPYRITMALRFIPQTISIPLYPVYSRLASSPDSREQFQAAYERGIKFFLFAGFLIATGFLIVSGKLTTFLLGARYQPAAPAMQLLGVGFLPFFVGNPLQFVLTARNDQRFLFNSVALSFLARVALDFCLIPFLGFFAPCIAFLLSEILIVVLSVQRLWLDDIKLNLSMLLWRPALASLGMALVLYPFRNSSWSLLIPVGAASALIYVIALVSLGSISGTDRQLLREGAGFVRPLLARFAMQAQRKAT